MKKSGAACSLKEFRGQIKRRVTSNALPDYFLEFDPTGDVVTVWTRDRGKHLQQVIAEVLFRLAGLSRSDSCDHKRSQATRCQDASTMPYLYHLCSREFRGSILYPLNDLRAIHPDLYAREKEKYSGRERVLDFVVPRIAVRWGDTVNLSALDPRRLVEERRRLGVPFSNFFSRRLLCIPIECIAELPATRYVATTHWLNSRPHDPSAPMARPDTDFSDFDPHSHQETADVPPLHRMYLQEQKAIDALALGFVFIPHVLVAGPIDVSGIEPLEML